MGFKRLLFVECINSENSKDYILLGLVIGLGILSKYLFYIDNQFKIIFLYLINKKKKIFNIYLFYNFVLLVILPHIFWLTENNYSTIIYGLQRTGGVQKFFRSHFIIL